MTLEAELFPPSDRVVYGKAPLTQVLCQVRYPQLLRIAGQPPADFQEKIRHIFPLVQRQTNDLADLPPEVAQMMGLAAQASSIFLFRTEDQKHTVTLVPDSLSYATTAYEEWPTFLRYLHPVLDALAEIYKPSFYQRVGLRYTNTILRSDLGVDGCPWSDLIRSEVLGEVALPNFAAKAVDAKRTLRLRVPNESGCGLYMQHGFAKKRDSNEIAYRLDFDFYRDAKTEVSDVAATLDSLNAMVGRAFRWCITETLHKRLEPRTVAMAKR